jgi:hypothetical protein
MKERIVAVVLTVLVGVGAIVAFAQPAAAYSKHVYAIPPRIEIHFTRSETKTIASAGSIVAIVVSACTLAAGPAGALACSAQWGSIHYYAGIAARSTTACLKLTFYYPLPGLWPGTRTCVFPGGGGGSWKQPAS